MLFDAIFSEPDGRNWYWWAGMDEAFVVQFFTDHPDYVMTKVDAYVEPGWQGALDEAFEGPKFCFLAEQAEAGDASWLWATLDGFDDISQHLSAANMVIKDLAAYPTIEGVRYAVLAEANRGQASWFGVGVDDAFFHNWLNQNPDAELTRLQHYLDDNGNPALAFVAREANGASWSYSSPNDLSSIGGTLDSFDAILTELSSCELSDHTQFSLLMTQNTGQGWAWYWGMDAAGIDQIVKQSGMQIVALRHDDGNWNPPTGPTSGGGTPMPNYVDGPFHDMTVTSGLDGLTATASPDAGRILINNPQGTVYTHFRQGDTSKSWDVHFSTVSADHAVIHDRGLSASGAFDQQTYLVAGLSSGQGRQVAASSLADDIELFAESPGGEIFAAISETNSIGNLTNATFALDFWRLEDGAHVGYGGFALSTLPLQTQSGQLDLQNGDQVSYPSGTASLS